MAEKQKTNIAWISGSYHYAKNIFDKVKERFKGLETFECNTDTSFMDLYTNLNSNQCFSSNKLIKIFGLPKMTDSEKKKLRTSLENLPDEVCVIFYMIQPKDEKAIFNTVEKIGKIYDFDVSVPLREAAGWVEKRCKELSINIDQNAIIALVENCGLDKDKEVSIDIMETAIQRLILYLPGKKIYNISDIITTAVFYENFIIWDLLNACDDKDYDKCLNLVAKANCLDNNVISGVAQMITTLLWKYRLLFFLKEKVENKVDKQKVLEEACRLRKITYIGTGLEAKGKVDPIATGENQGKPSTVWTYNIVNSALNGGFYNKKPGVELYTRKELYLIIKSLEDASMFLRTCSMENEAFIIADTVIMTICSCLNFKQISNIQNSLMKTRI